MIRVRAAWVSVGRTGGSGRRGSVQCLEAAVAGALPASPDSFNITHQVLGQADPKNLGKEGKDSQTVELLTLD